MHRVRMVFLPAFHDELRPTRSHASFKLFKNGSVGSREFGLVRIRLVFQARRRGTRSGAAAAQPSTGVLADGLSEASLTEWYEIDDGLED